MKTSIGIVVPYFGTLPYNYQLWLDTCATNSKVLDFIVFTNDRTPYNYPDNVHPHFISFDEIKLLFTDKLRELGIKNFYLGKPYKLCDYKAAYGYLFEEYLKGYDYWGFADIDVVWGKMDTFFNKIEIDQYDRIFKYGHLTIIKNDDQNRMLFTKEVENVPPGGSRFKYAVSTTYPCHFDELGLNLIYYRLKLKFYEPSYHVNLWFTYQLRTHYPISSENKQMFVRFPDGRLFHYWENENGEVEKKEIMYLHFMFRKGMDFRDYELNHPILLTHHGCHPFDEDNMEGMMHLANDADEKEIKKYEATKNKNKWKVRWNKLSDELRYNKLLTIRTIILRLYGSYYYRKWW